MLFNLVSLWVRVTCAYRPSPPNPGRSPELSGFSHPRLRGKLWPGDPKTMTTKLSDQSPPSPQIAAIMAALTQARKARHHKTCACMRHNTYCNDQDEKWSKAVDKELDRLCE